MQCYKYITESSKKIDISKTCIYDIVCYAMLWYDMEFEQKRPVPTISQW